MGIRLNSFYGIVSMYCVLDLGLGSGGEESVFRIYCDTVSGSGHSFAWHHWVLQIRVRVCGYSSGFESLQFTTVEG